MWRAFVRRRFRASAQHCRDRRRKGTALCLVTCVLTLAGSIAGIPTTVLGTPASAAQPVCDTQLTYSDNPTSLDFGTLTINGAQSAPQTVCFEWSSDVYYLTQTPTFIASSDHGFSITNQTCTPLVEMEHGPLVCTMTVIFTAPSPIVPPLLRRGQLEAQLACETECSLGQQVSMDVIVSATLGNSCLNFNDCPTTTTTSPTKTTTATTTTTTVPASGCTTTRPTMDIVPAVGPPGSVLTIDGSGFRPGQSVQLSWNVGLETAQATVTSLCTFRATLLIFPHDQPGPRDLSASANPLARAHFVVVPASGEPGGSHEALLFGR